MLIVVNQLHLAFESRVIVILACLEGISSDGAGRLGACLCARKVVRLGILPQRVEVGCLAVASSV